MANLKKKVDTLWVLVCTDSEGYEVPASQYETRSEARASARFLNYQRKNNLFRVKKFIRQETK